MTDDDNALLAQLDDPNEQTRVAAAQALHARKHPRAAQACVRTIDDGADMLHLDDTPAVRCLVEIGLPALGLLVDALMAPGELTRLHAQRAIEQITIAQPDFQASDRQAQEASWRTWWAAIGYAYDAPPVARQDAVARLRGWAATRVR